MFHPYESGDWKVARTRRLESLRYIITVNALINMISNVLFMYGTWLNFVFYNLCLMDKLC